MTTLGLAGLRLRVRVCYKGLGSRATSGLLRFGFQVRLLMQGLRIFGDAIQETSTPTAL